MNLEVVESIPNGYKIARSQGEYLIITNGEKEKAIATNGADLIFKAYILIGDVRRAEAFIKRDSDYRSKCLAEALPFIQKLRYE